MSQEENLIVRAKAWIIRERPGTATLLSAHNNLVHRVRTGKESFAEAEGALESIGEAFVEAGGDPTDLEDLNPPEAVTIAANTSYDSEPGDYALYDYSDVSEPAVLTGAAKLAAFRALCQQVGVNRVTAV